MDCDNPGRRYNPQNQGPIGQQSRFRYGIHFSNAPTDIDRADLEAVWSDFGECRLKMDLGASHGWVGYDTIPECNRAFKAMNPNDLGMYIHKGPYEAGPMLRPPTGGPGRGRPAMGGPPMGRPAMGGPPMGRPAVGGAPMVRPLISGTPMVGPLMGGQYPRNYGLSCVPRRPPMDYYEDDFYDYYGDPYESMGYGYDAYDDMSFELPGCDVGPCIVCQARTSYSCERCGAFYCSEICQRQDWITHRELCDKNIPSLNFGPRHRPGSGDIIEDRMQRLAIADVRGDGPSSRPYDQYRSGERTPPTDRRQGGVRRPEGESKGQRRADDASGDQGRSGGSFSSRDNDQRRNEDYDRRPTTERRNENGFGSRRGDGDSKPTGERRNEGGFDDRRGDGNSKPTGERRNENGYDDRRGDGDKKPMGERRNEGSFGDRRGDGDRKPMGERRNEGGFGERRGDGDRKPMGERRNEGGYGDRRGDGDRKPMGERRYEGGFSDRRGDGDRKPIGERRNEGGFGNRRGDGDRKPMGERRNEGGFADRRGDGDRKPMGERRNENGIGDRRPMGERDNDGASGDRRQAGNQIRDRESGSTEDRPSLGENKKSPGGPVKSHDGKVGSLRDAVSGGDKPSIAMAGSELKTNVALSSLLKKSSGGDVSHTEKKSELLAEKGVCVDLKVNDSVVITNATAMDNIYVTPPTSALSEDFKKVVTGIALHCKDAPALERAPALNEVVACQFTLDNDFYRAVVKETLPEGGYVMQFCDYGNVQRCKIDKLRAIPDELKKCPWNAVKVSLCKVNSVPIVGAIQKLFLELTNNEVELKLHFDGDISKGVVLVKPNGKSVNDEVNSIIRQAAAPKVDTPAPKDDPPAPKMDVPAPAKESGASVSNEVVAPRSPDQILSVLSKKFPVHEPEPPTTYPAEEGVCTQLNNDETVVITASTSTGSTYITRATISREMAEVTAKLNEHCETAPPLGREPREKELVACQFVDKLFYRAFVSEVLPNGEYLLTFCDYGNSEKFKAADMKAVPNELKVLPRQAVQIYFRDVDPVPVTGKIGEILNDLSAEETQLKLRFSGSIENGVELIRPDGKSVNEELRAVITQAQKPASAPAAATSAEPAEDLSPAASVPLPTDKSFTLLIFGILGEFLVAACNADAPELAQFEKTFAPRILEHCEKSQEKEHRPEPGEMCLAKFNDDWYRALTMSAEEDGTRDVFFVDYGNTSKVKPSDIRKITQEIKTQLHTLTLCNIVGVRETPDVWTKIKTRIEKDIEQQSVAMFPNVTAAGVSDSTAEITIPEFKAL